MKPAISLTASSLISLQLATDLLVSETPDQSPAKSPIDLISTFPAPSGNYECTRTARLQV